MLYPFVVSQDVLHNCQLHRISFCADDKTDKRIFTFICKDSESNKHLCYVFDSEKCVSVICMFSFFWFQQTFATYPAESVESLVYFIMFTGSHSKRNTVVSCSFVATHSEDHYLCSLAAGGRDNSNNWSGLWLGLQEVPGVWRQRRGNQETDWKPTEESMIFFFTLTEKQHADSSINHFKLSNITTLSCVNEKNYING